MSQQPARKTPAPAAEQPAAEPQLLPAPPAAKPTTPASSPAAEVPAPAETVQPEPETQAEAVAGAEAPEAAPAAEMIDGYTEFRAWADSKFARARADWDLRIGDEKRTQIGTAGQRIQDDLTRSQEAIQLYVEAAKLAHRRRVQEAALQAQAQAGAAITRWDLAPVGGAA